MRCLSFIANPAGALYRESPLDGEGWQGRLGETTPLLLDYAAGDAITGVAGGVGHQIVGFGVDDQRSTAFVEERIGAITERDAVGDEVRIAIAVLVHHEIHQIAEVRMWLLCVVDAVVGRGRVEVAAS